MPSHNEKGEFQKLLGNEASFLSEKLSLSVISSVFFSKKYKRPQYI